MSAVTSLGFSIWSRFDGSGTTRADRALRRLSRNVNNSSRGINVLSGRLQLMATAALAVGPALFPIAGALAGVTAGAIAMSVTGGAALGIFGLAMNGAIKNALTAKQSFGALQGELAKQKDILSLLTPGTAAYATQLKKVNKAQDMYNHALARVATPQRLFILSIDSLKFKWQEFIKATQGDTLLPATIVINTLARNLMKLVPVVHAVAPIATQVARSFAGWANTGGLDRFIGIIIKFGVPALNALRRAGVDTLAVLGIGFRESLRFVKPLTDAIEKGAHNLRHWAEGGGFDRFFDKVQKNGPQTKEFFKELGKSMGVLLKALQGMGPLSFSTTIFFLKLVGNMNPDDVRHLAEAYLALKLALTGWGAASGGANLLIRLATFLSEAGLAGSILGIASVLGIIAAVVLALGVDVYLLVTRWHVFTTYMSSSFMDAMRKVWGLLQTVGHWIAGVFSHVWDGVRFAWGAAWRGIAAGTMGAWNTMVRSVFQPIGRFFTQTIPRWANIVWQRVVGAWRGMGGGVRGAFSTLTRQVFQPIGRFFTLTIPRWANLVWRSVVRAWAGMGGGLRGVFNTINRTVFQPIFRFFTRTIPGWAGTLKNKIVEAFRTMVSGVRTAWNKFKGVVAAPVRFFVNVVYSGLRKAWNNTAGRIPHVPKLGPAHVNFASGGHVRGRGGPTADRIPAMLSNGEYVINAAAVRKIGVSQLDGLNFGGSKAGKAKRGKSGLPGMFLGGLLPDPIDILRNAAKGVGGIMGDMLKMAKSVPGLGKVIDNLLKWGGDITKALLRKAMPVIFKPFKAMVNGMLGKFGGSGMVATLIKNLANSGFDKMAQFVIGKGKDDFNPADFGGAFGGGGGGGAGRWMSTVLMALKLAGESFMWAPLVIKAINKESGGNPNAINLTDSNAKAGHPSRGLLQTIPGTFNAYAGSLRGLGITNPLANIYAAIRYARARYGGGWAMRMAAPGGYAMGGLVANSYDKGGYLPKGLSLAYNGTGKPERVGHGWGGVNVSFSNCTFAGGRNEFEDLVVKAVSEAKRKKRL